MTAWQEQRRGILELSPLRVLSRVRVWTEAREKQVWDLAGVTDPGSRVLGLVEVVSAALGQWVAEKMKHFEALRETGRGQPRAIAEPVVA
jgi:hypothetical protein